MDEANRDSLIRIAAFQHVRMLGESHDHLTRLNSSQASSSMADAFHSSILSVAYSSPNLCGSPIDQNRKRGGKVRYGDQRAVHRQIFEGDETIDYAFMGQDPDAAYNRWLREAFENRIPIIYFLGIAHACYQAILQAFISGWDGKALKARVAFGSPDQETLAPPETALERRDAPVALKQRLHQASFREAVVTAPT